MNGAVVHSMAMNLRYAKQLVADIPDEKLCVQPKGLPAEVRMNHGAWVLGHLASTAAFVAGMVGEKVPVPQSWEKLFGWGSKPGSDPREYPGKAEMLRVLEEGQAKIAAAIEKLPASRWDEPFPTEEMRSFVPTLGDGVVFLMTAHAGTHLGQLSAWRRAQGLPSVM